MHHHLPLAADAGTTLFIRLRKVPFPWGILRQDRLLSSSLTRQGPVRGPTGAGAHPLSVAPIFRKNAGGPTARCAQPSCRDVGRSFSLKPTFRCFRQRREAEVG